VGLKLNSVYVWFTLEELGSLPINRCQTVQIKDKVHMEIAAFWNVTTCTGLISGYLIMTTEAASRWVKLFGYLNGQCSENSLRHGRLELTGRL